MMFLSLNNANIVFIDFKFNRKFYTTAKTLPSIPKIEIINRTESAKAVVDKNIKAFIVYIAFLYLELIYLG